MNKYAYLDERICKYLERRGIHPNNSIHLIALATKMIADLDLTTNAVRLIDRRLQAMRKEGKIIYVRGVRPHWEIRSEVGA